jgi:hypothetical protein
VAFLDQDDVWCSPHKLAEQMAAAREFPAAELVYGSFVSWFDWDAATPQPDEEHDLGFTESTLVEAPGLIDHWYGGVGTPGPGQVLVRRDTFRRLGGFEVGFRTPCEDQTFMVKAALEVAILAVPRPWLRYRHHAGSCTSAWDRIGELDNSQTEFFKWALAYVRARGHPNGDEVTDVLRRALYGAALWERARRKRR